MPRVSAFLLALVLLALSTSSSALDTRFLQGIGDSHYQRLKSETIGRDFHIFIKLPDGYEEHPERSYPTVYVLDGGALFPLLAAYYRYLNFGQEIPDAITVGIS